MMQPPMSVDEISRKGDELYQSSIRPQVDVPTNHGKVIVIDVDTGEYVVDSDHLRAVSRARALRPEAVLYATRIGYPALGRIGLRREGPHQ